MEFKNTDVWGFKHALRGMRNPKDSWDKSDSEYWLPNKSMEENVCGEDIEWKPYHIGKNDMELAQTLIKGGTEHRKFLRQIFVSVDITAPLYWWKEFDTYKIGTTANSTSTMHRLVNKPIALGCFEIDDYNPDLEFRYAILTENGHDTGWTNETINEVPEEFVEWLEKLRQRYIETKDKRYWKELIRWLPESWLQTRTVTMNYENLRNMYFQRKYHKLNEWSGKDDPTKENFCKWVESLPYAKEFIMYEGE